MKTFPNELIHVIVGSGFPAAWHVRLTLEPSTTVRLLLRNVKVGGTKKDYVLKSNTRIIYCFLT